MKRTLAAALLALACVLPPPVAGQPAQLTERGCSVLADMAIVARSLAEEKVERGLALRILGRVYAPYEAELQPAAMRERVLALAYARNENPIELARLVATACLRSGGNVDATLGPVTWRPRARGIRA